MAARIEVAALLPEIGVASVADSPRTCLPRSSTKLEDKPLHTPQRGVFVMATKAPAGLHPRASGLSLSSLRACLLKIHPLALARPCCAALCTH